jgi:hypothetical protein
MLVAILAAAALQGSPGVCVAFSGAVIDGEKELAYISVDGVGDNSAPRETVRAVNSSVEMSRIQANITLMAAQQCPLPNQPVDINAYGLAALDCKIANTKIALAMTKGATFSLAPECERAAWKRNPGK